MRSHIETEIKVGIFVSIGLALTLFAILMLGGTQKLFTRHNQFTVHFSRVDGLIVGSKVILNGVPVGAVDAIEFDRQNKSVRVLFSVSKEESEWIRKDSAVEIATQGVLGDKYISIDAGSQDEPILPPNSDLPYKPSADISQFLSQSDHLMASLNGIATGMHRIVNNFDADNRSNVFFKGLTATALNLSKTSEKLNRELDQIQIKNAISNLNQILTKMNNGTGTLGALINDPGLYDDVKALFGGANRNRIIRNLVRQTVKDSKSKQPATPAGQ